MTDEQVQHIADDAAHDAKDNRARLLAWVASTVSILALVFAVVTLWTDRSTAEDERDVAESAVGRTDPVIAELLAACQAGRADQLPPGLSCAEVRDAQESIEDVGEVQEDEQQESEIQQREIDDPDPDDPDRPDDPDPDDPDPNDPDNDDPETQDDEQQEAEVQDDETQDGEIDNPDPTDDPDPNDPDPTDDPDPNDPDPNDQPVSPYPFTFDFSFTLFGMTFTQLCTIDDPTDNQCEAA